MLPRNTPPLAKVGATLELDFQLHWDTPSCGSASPTQPVQVGHSSTDGHWQQKVKMAAIGWQGAVVAAVLGFSLIIMAFDWVGPDLVFGGMTTFFIITGILSLRDAAAGFSNTGVLTVMMLYLVAEGVTQTGGLDLAMNLMLGKANTTFWAQVRMMIPVMIASAFLNNTPIVALMIPILISWGRRCGISPKKLLIPMSFATVLGGTTTLIGTSTNLVVSGLQEAKYGTKNPEYVFGFFTITPWGVPYAIWGMAYIILFSKWLLPGDDAADDLNSALYVPEGSRTAGKSAKASGLYGGKLQLNAFSRKNAPAVPFSPEVVLQSGDVIYVTGSVMAVEQAARDYGLVLLTSDHDVNKTGNVLLDAAATNVEEGFDLAATDNPTSTLLQVSVKKGAPVVGKCIRDIGFRGRFNAAVIAAKRAKVRQPGRLGDLVLQEKDVLVISTGSLFNPTDEDFKANFEKPRYLDEALARQFTTAVRVGPKSKEAGKSIKEVGLRGINGLYLFEIERANGDKIRVVDHDTVLEKGDILWFAGDLDGVAYLQKYTTLVHMQADQVAKLHSDIIYRRMVEVVVSHNELAGKRLKDVHFRQTYGAAVLGIHRQGHPIAGNIAEVPLKQGDVLIVEAGPDFHANFKNNRAFSLVSEVPKSSPMKRSKMWIALAITVAMVATQVIGGAINNEFIHLWPCAMLAAGLMLVFKCMSADQARDSVEWSIYVCIAFAFAVSTAMEKTKLAKAIADVFVALSNKIGGQTAALCCIYLVTAILSEMLTNNAAGAIMYPIASATADQLGIGPNIMSVAVMLGASAGWVLPYSYQCNLMVMAAGKYRTADFIKIGLPYHVWLFVGVLLILGSGNNWVIPLVASMVFTAVIIIVPGIYEYVLSERQRNALSAAAGKLLPGKKAHSSWTDLPAVGHDQDDLIVKDVGGGKDAGQPRHRH